MEIVGGVILVAFFVCLLLGGLGFLAAGEDQ